MFPYETLKYVQKFAKADFPVKFHLQEAIPMRFVSLHHHTRLLLGPSKTD